MPTISAGRTVNSRRQMPCGMGVVANALPFHRLGVRYGAYGLRVAIFKGSPGLQVSPLSCATWPIVGVFATVPAELDVPHFFIRLRADSLVDVVVAKRQIGWKSFN